ncbi:MAG TPA: holo-ACP synthase [Nitrospiria bacterium]|nr:holo-ACP synthase [Nitrospiria bacterium]
MTMLGCGVDLVYVPRMERACRQWGDHFLSRVFTAQEKSYCYRQRMPYRHLSGRFAAKEALIKAMGGFKITRWVEMEVLSRAEGAPPEMVVHGETATVLKERGVNKILLSISHDHNYSVATVCLTIAP